MQKNTALLARADTGKSSAGGILKILASLFIS